MSTPANPQCMSYADKVRDSIKRDNERRALRGIVTKSTDHPMETPGQSIFRRLRGSMPVRWRR